MSTSANTHDNVRPLVATASLVVVGVVVVTVPKPLASCFVAHRLELMADLATRPSRASANHLVARAERPRVGSICEPSFAAAFLSFRARAQ